jgi:ribosomal protein S18 acetylase RimI-like enzyme
MTRIRSLRPDDLSQVVALYRSYLAWPHIADDDELLVAFEQMFLNQPLSDPSIPSLVIEGADGAILGFIGSLVHRMRFEERPVRLACSSSLVVSPRARQLGAGGLLLRTSPSPTPPVLPLSAFGNASAVPCTTSVR